MGNPNEKTIREFVDKVKEGNFTEEQSSELLTLVADKPTQEQFGKAIQLFTKYSQVNQKAEASTEAIDPLKDFKGYLLSDKKAAEYYSIAVLTGTVSATEEPSELAKRQFLADFEAWKIAGEPRPTMPKIKAGLVKIPTASYRIRDRKSDKLYTYLNDGTVDGIKEEFFKKTTIDPNTNETIELEENDEKRKPVKTYDNEFTPEKAQKIIDDADKLIAPGVNFQLYFWYKGAKHIISEKNFVEPYEKVAEMIERKQSID